jgi:hypothetical protein
MFQFTADGNLQVPEMRGEAAKILDLPSYRPALDSENAEPEARRRDELVNVEKEYDETFLALKEAMAIWRATGSSTEAIRLQKELMRLDSVRSQLRSPLRFTKEFKRLSIREVLVDQFYQVKKLGYPVFAIRLRPNPFEEYTRLKTQDEAAAQPEPEAAAEPEPEPEEEFFFFSDPEESPLSPDTMVEFIYNSTKYNSLVQAYEVERITKLGRRKDLGPLLLRSRSPAQIRTIASRITGDVENPRELWIDILKSLLTQHPRYADVLRETGTATLVYANPKEGRWGIGMSADEEGASDRNEWKGPNVLGQAWQAVRLSLPAEPEPEAAEPEAVQAGGYTEHGKTEKESKEQRSNVLKGYYRKMKSFS